MIERQALNEMLSGTAALAALAESPAASASRDSTHGRYDFVMTKAELHAQIESMSDEEAAQVKLIFAPEWPSKATSIEEIRKRTGTKPMSPADFDRHFGSLSTDGEG